MKVYIRSIDANFQGHPSFSRWMLHRLILPLWFEGFDKVPFCLGQSFSFVILISDLFSLFIYIYIHTILNTRLFVTVKSSVRKVMFFPLIFKTFVWIYASQSTFFKIMTFITRMTSIFKMLLSNNLKFKS